MQGLIHLHNHYIPIYSQRQSISVYKYTVTRQNLISQSRIQNPVKCLSILKWLKNFVKSSILDI